MRGDLSREYGTFAGEVATVDWIAFFLGSMGLIRVSVGSAPGTTEDLAVHHWWVTVGLPSAAIAATAGVLSLMLLARRRGTGYPVSLGWWVVAPTGLLSLAALFPAYYLVGRSLEQAGMLLDGDGFWRPEMLLLWVTLPGMLLGLVIVWAGRRTAGPSEKAGESVRASNPALPSADGGERGLLN